MREVEYWRWWVVSETSGKRVKSRHAMTEAVARALDPAAEPVPGTRELRLVPETPEEAEQARSGRVNRGPEG